jgi:hypothetical protein
MVGSNETRSRIVVGEGINAVRNTTALANFQEK